MAEAKTLTIYIRRFVVEAVSPLAISSGESDALHDNLLARDANGLPMIPATSIAGALRASIKDPALQNDWFGYQDGKTGSRSQVTLSDGLFHWGADDRPRDGLVVGQARAKLETDVLCREVLRDDPLARPHVRLNHAGTVDGDGKFSRNAVPRGARFTFELRTTKRAIAEAMTDTVARGLFLGGATRSGYGKLVCRRIHAADFALKADWEKWKAFAQTDLGNTAELVEATVATFPSPAGWAITGTIEGPLLVGGPPRGPEEDRAPWREMRFVWDGSTGKVERNVYVLPGSAIKGTLRHRTLYNLRLKGVQNPDRVCDGLFGKVALDDTGQAGKLRFTDCVVENPRVFRQTHVGLDRFHGGARDGVLWTDAALWRPKLALLIEKIVALDPDEHEAFERALDDMTKGLCGIGAEWGEGAGIFSDDTRVTPPLSTGGDADAA
jgi:CRISPR/Cas system CMR subunit Cmr4 (Cas7 group RAMP superfamily)